MALPKDAGQESLLDFPPLVKPLQQLVSLIGVEKTISVLEYNYKKQSLIKNSDAVYLRELVGGELGCSEGEILFGKTRDQKRYYSIGFCCYYLHVVLKHDIEDVVYMMNKNRWVCYKTIKVIAKLNPKHKADARHIGIKERLDKIVRKYKLIQK